MGQYKQDVWQAKREQAVHLRRLGYSYRQLAESLGTSKAWVSKGLRRFAVDGWEGLADRSRRPRRCPRRLPESVRQAVIRARSALEAEAARGGGAEVHRRPGHPHPTAGANSRAFERRRSRDAVAFRTELWRQNGIPTYTQMDNESGFSGGHHPGVLGRVIRAALIAGTEVVFSPTRHPQSQGTVEAFHRVYGQHVWEGTLLANLEAVNAKAQRFLAAYRQRPHPQVGERSPSRSIGRADAGPWLPGPIAS